MSKLVSRRDFLKGAAATAATAVAGSMLVGCSSNTTGKSLFKAGTYTSVQSTSFGSVEVKCVFSASALEKVSYEVLSTSDSDFFSMKEAELKKYCDLVNKNGSTLDVDAVSGATLSSNAIKDGVNACVLQAMDIKVSQTKTDELNPQDYDYRSNTIADMAQSEFFKEWKFGPLTIRNKLVKSAAGSHYLAGTPKEEIIGDYASWAKGGVGFVWVEDFVNMYERYPAVYKELTRETAPLKELTDAIHAEGAYCGYQLSLMGAEFSGFKPLGPGDFTCAQAHHLNRTEIKEVIETFAESARYLKSQGFDAVEINCAGNNIGQAFLSRNRNLREDEYGAQSIENRARFVSEMITKIKEYCGKDFPVQILINGIEENDEELGKNEAFTTVEENQALAKYLEAAGCDSLHVRIGPHGIHVVEFAPDLYFTGKGITGTTGFGTRLDFSKHFQGKLCAKNSGCGLMLDVAKEIRSAVSIPVGTVTYMDPAHAPDLFNNALKEGKADFLLMTRTLQADHEYVNKLKENRIDEIAPCTRCLHCHFDYDDNGNFNEHCRVNASHMKVFHPAMPEGYEPKPADGNKKVMVVGGGPAGMETARIAAQRGYDVTLYEKKGTLGGMLDFAHAVKGPHENLDSLKAYLIRQCELKGVNVVTGTEVTKDLITSVAPDVVVLATGGKRPELPFASTSKTKVIGINDVLSGNVGKKVVVLGANLQAIDAAMYLMDQGVHVTMINEGADAIVARGHSSWVKTFELPIVRQKLDRLWNNASLKSVNDGTVTILCETGVDMTIDCDTVIDCRDQLTNTSLMEGLTGITTYAVGDCSNPFNISEAIASGNITARNI